MTDYNLGYRKIIHIRYHKAVKENTDGTFLTRGETLQDTYRGPQSFKKARVMESDQWQASLKIILEFCQLTSKTTLSSQISNMIDGNKNKNLHKLTPPVLKRKTLKK